MANSFEKVDGNVIKATRPQEQNWSYESLVRRKEMLEKDLAFVNEALAKAQEFGVSPKQV